MAFNWRACSADTDLIRPHIVENFLDDEMQTKLKAEFFKNASLWRSGRVNGAMTYRCCGDDEEYPSIVKSAVQRIQRYAEQMLHPQTTLENSHGFRGSLTVQQMSMVRYIPRGGAVVAHTDTDVYARCVSAGLYLNDVQYAHGGTLQMRRCSNEMPGALCENHPNGTRLIEMYIRYGRAANQRCTIRERHELQVIDEIQPREGRLVFFRSEHWHSVSELIEGHRDVIFVWFGCDPKCAILSSGKWLIGTRSLPEYCSKRYLNE